MGARAGAPLQGGFDREESGMDFEFIVTDEGWVDVVIHDDLPIMADALRDSLGTRPPCGAPQDGPSTYWLDRAVIHLRDRLENPGDEPIASGNTTYLEINHGMVGARYDYDPVDSDYVDRVPADELLDLLQAWRRKTLVESPLADERMPPLPTARPMPPAP